MNITVTDQQQCKKQLRLEIPAETVRAETDRVAANLARQVNVPGFRRGHVPTSVIKTRFRKELRDEVLSHLLPHALTDAIREKELKVIGEPAIDDLKFGEDQSIDVTFTLDVAPEFELSDYAAIPLTKYAYKVRDEDVEKTVDRLRERQTELVPVEDRGASQGDIVTVNITGQFEPGTEQAASDEAGEEAKPEEAKSEEASRDEEIKQQDLEIEIGAEGVMKEFTEALTDARPGDTRTFSVEYAQDYGAPQYAGRRINYTAEVVAVRAKVAPEADDAFAASVGDEFKTIDELRADIRSRLEHDADQRSNDELRVALMEKLIESNRFEVPEFIVERQIDSRMNTLLRQMSGQGMDPRRMDLDWQGIRESQRERAEREVRGTFVIGKIAEKEKIEVTEDELNQELEAYAAGTQQDIAQLRARLTKEDALDSIKEQIRNRKALDLVIASANLQTEEVEGLTREQKADAKGEGDAAADEEGGQAEE